MNTDKSMERPRQILVGTYYLDHVGGSQLYAVDLLKELQRRDDIEVEFFAVNQGRLSDYVENDLGIPFMSKRRYDLVLAAQNVTVDTLRKRGPVVQICHGAILELENPSIYADFHVGITKEVCDSLSTKGYPNHLVLNGLDLTQKRPTRAVNDELEVVLSLCQSEEANELLAKVCSRQGVEFLHYNKHKNPTFNIEHEINKADLVVGIGRSVFDAMACGRPCVVFDSRDYNGNRGDGYLHPDLFDAFVETNCSGRYRSITFNEDDLMREMEQYNPDDGQKLRRIAEEKLNVVQTTQELLNMDSQLTWETSMRKKARIFRKRLKRLRKSIKKKLKKLF